ncbi:MAG: MEKHLA domain-containing protein [Gammaproteobacteria bacterium]
MKDRPPRPAADNDWAAAHVDRLLDSHARLTGRPLWVGPQTGVERARAVFEAPFALLSHGLEDDPLFNYGNRTALELFELAWDDFVRTPSRASAETAKQAAREAFMRGVREHGYVDGYAGVRISASGRRFVIEDTTVWNVVTADGVFHGQAASFAHWRDC